MENKYKVGQILVTERHVSIYVGEMNGRVIEQDVDYPIGTSFEIVEVILSKHKIPSYSINFLIDNSDIIYKFDEWEINSFILADEIKIITEIGIGEKFVYDVCEYFDKSIEDFAESVKVGDVRVFPDFRVFFDWYFEIDDKEDIIQELWEVYNSVKQVKDIVDENSFIKLKDDTVVYMM